MRRVLVLLITLAAGLILPAATSGQTVEQSTVQQPVVQQRVPEAKVQQFFPGGLQARKHCALRLSCHVVLPFPCRPDTLGAAMVMRLLCSGWVAAETLGAVHAC